MPCAKIFSIGEGPGCGTAFWACRQGLLVSKASGGFVTSNYYYQHYPDWVNEWNARKPARAYAVSSTALRTDKLPDTLMMRAILRNFHAKRSGSIGIPLTEVFEE